MGAQLEKKEEEAKCANHRWTPLLALVCYATTIGTAIPVGYCLGVTNTPAEFIKTWCVDMFRIRYNSELSETNLDVLWAGIVSGFLVGGILGSFVGAWCCNKFGRKGCLFISAFLLLASGILFNFCREANSIEMLVIGRLLAGVASALIYTAHPMYLSEIAPTELRSSVAVFTAVGVTGGICVGQIFSLPQVFGTESLWQYALSFHAVFVVICFLPGYWFPESPRWLFEVKENPKLARIELERLRGSNSEHRVTLELAHMETMSKSNEEKASFFDVLRNSELLLPLILVCSLQFCQQLSGINAIFFYSVSIFMKAGFSSENAAWMNLGAGFLNFGISMLGPLLMSKFNRRPLMLLSSACCAALLATIAFALYYIDLLDWLPVACIVLIAAFIVFFQFGLGPIPYFIGSELFEVTPRPVGMSMGSLFSWTGNFMIGMFFPLIQNVWGSFVFLPCCAFCIYCFFLTLFYLPETRGRDPRDVKHLMQNGLKSKVRL